MVIRESRICSSSRIWYSTDILPSSSDIFWDRRRQLSHPDGEVSGGIPVGLVMVAGETKQLWPVKVILMVVDAVVFGSALEDRQGQHRATLTREGSTTGAHSGE